MGEGDNVEDLEFKWGKKRGVGGKKKEVQFYESFAYDGVEYRLYDCVYLYKDEETEPYIGKIVKIWEQPSKAKRVKVLWFFRPSEIYNHLGAENVCENELFLASGEGPGLANVNPLEAIAGKCNVICTSKDSRNPQLLDGEVKMADFIYYRTFDVGHRKILDKIDEKIAGIDVIHLFNRVDPQKPVTEDATVMTSKQNICKEEDSKINVSTILEAAAKGNPDSKVHLLTEGGLSGGGVRLGKKAIKSEKNSVGEVAKEIGDLKATPAMRKLPTREKLFDTVNDSTEIRISGKKEKMPGDQTTMRAKVDSKRNEAKLSKVRAPVSGFERVKNARESGELDDRPSKKAKLESSAKIPEDKSFFRKTESADRVAKLPNSELLKASPRHSLNEEKPTNFQKFEVTRKPESGKSKWLKELPWDEKLKNANEQGTVVLLENLDPAYTYAEVEDIIWHAFKENCKAKMIQRTTTSSPHYGRALIIFKTRNSANSVVRKLNGGCLMLPNGRPVVGSFAASCVPAKPSSIPGHLNIERLRHHMQREMRQAVSTSHCSQPNTIEYDMAMEWCLQHEISDLAWKKLHKQQGEELRKLRAQLKSKSQGYTQS